MWRSSKFGFPLLLIIGFSCSIIKDSDVTSLDQLKQLKLTSIEIQQTLSTTSGIQSSSAKVTDSVYATPATTTVDVNGKINGSIVSRKKIEWPTFSKTKLLFRSKISSSGIVVYYSSYSSGAIRSCTVYQNNQLKEWYSFFYDKNWKLTNVYSRVYTSIPAADTTIYRDSLIYNSTGYVSSLIRKSPTTPSKAGTLNFSYQTYSSNSSPALGGGTGPIQYSGYNYNYGNCNCPSGNGNTCSGADAYPGNNSIDARYIITAMQTSIIVTQLQIEDIKITNGSNNCGGNGGPSNYDTYYFHPLMLLRGLFTHGDILLHIYAIDWWQPGGAASGTQQNETVTFNFNYAH